jgi:hypothetical protein
MSKGFSIVDAKVTYGGDMGLDKRDYTADEVI